MYFLFAICCHYCLCEFPCVAFFFFKQKTAYELRISDWSSDVCSSDLTTLCAILRALQRQRIAGPQRGGGQEQQMPAPVAGAEQEQLVAADGEHADDEDRKSVG